MIRNVLIVDDDREMLFDLQEGLCRRDPSLAVLMAGNGIEALESLRSHDVSLVVTDLKMPVMDGQGLLAAIMQSYADIPVIVMTGFGTPEKERQLRADGAAEFLAKPFTVDLLARQVGGLLDQQSEGGTLHQVSSANFLQLIEMEQKTCTVRLEDMRSGRRGILSFVQGELFDARVGEVLGLNAAYQILGWEPVSLSLQNSCLIRNNRIRKNLCPLILEAARRRDETTPSKAGERPLRGSMAVTADPGESLAQFRAWIEKEMGADCGVEDVFEDPSWNDRVERLSRHGEQLNLGRLVLAWETRGESRDYIVRPGAPHVIIAVNPKCPREKLMQRLGG
jgi:CheY-like chemotaxis protein